MNNTAIRQELHHYIDVADDKKIDAIYTIFQSDMMQSHTYSTEELAMLHKRAEKYLNGQGKTYSVEESHDQIRQQKNKA